MMKEKHRCEDPRCWRNDGTHSDECCHRTPMYSINIFERAFTGFYPTTLKGKYVRIEP